MNWYQLDTETIFRDLRTSDSGLTSEEAKTRLHKFGYNELAEEEKTSRFKIFLHQFTSPTVYILIAAGIITAVLKEFIDSTVIFIIVVLNAIIGSIQEYKAEESVKSLKKMIVTKAQVIRDGGKKEIIGKELTPGDIVLLESGMRAPADIRLFHTIELRIDESMLTGESLPAEKGHLPIKQENLTPGDQKNMAFMGTIIVSGRAKGVVAETGKNTVLGKIAREVKEAGLVKAPIQEKIDKFAKAIGLLVFGATILLLITGLFVGESIKDMFMISVAAAVAIIPEGLPIVITIAMAIGVARMAKHNAIIRNLSAVETLGSTTVICTDKTGTLTKNEMTVKFIYDGKSIYEVTGNGYEPRGEILDEGKNKVTGKSENFIQLLRIGLLCTESNIYEEHGRFYVNGDPTEGALIVSAMKAGLETESEKQNYQQIGIIPFESEKGYMATLHRHKDKKIIFVKGSPERVINMCKISSAEIKEKEILHIAGVFAGKGMRLLAMAYKEIQPEKEEITHNDVENGLSFAGIQGMIDPPRAEAIEAIQNCRKAGIRVIMITGDHAVTAGFIAREMGIGDSDPEVISGAELDAMSDEQLSEKVNKISVYARVSPQHKLRLTNQLKNHGEIVAMTGDGVNDASSLKAAHIGIAMGRSGTDVAKEASDMVLTDDNFASIFSAVREGRVVFDNLRKVIFFLIPTGVAAILSILGTISFGMPIPYLPAQLLWINLVTNGLQDVALAFEPGEEGIIDRPPKLPQEPLMSSVLIQRTILVSIVIAVGVIYNFSGSLKAGETLEKARSVAITTMVFFQFFQAWNSRSESISVFGMRLFGNPFIFFSMIAAFLAQISVLYLPPLQRLFRTEPVTGNEWLRILLTAATVIFVVEIDKLIRKRIRAL